MEYALLIEDYDTEKLYDIVLFNSKEDLLTGKEILANCDGTDNYDKEYKGFFEELNKQNIAYKRVSTWRTYLY